MAPVPPGIRFLTSFNRDQWYRAFTFVLTFLLYTSFHLSRKPISIVKSELHKNCSVSSLEFPDDSSDRPPSLSLSRISAEREVPGVNPAPGRKGDHAHANPSANANRKGANANANANAERQAEGGGAKAKSRTRRGADSRGSGTQMSLSQNSADCSWKPFDKSNYKELLGAMDYSFLCAYAIGMYLSGIIGERLPIRLYLSVGMVTSGIFTCLFGLGYIYNIHSLSFYITIQVCNGLVQTTGWPSVVTCIGNWFGKGRRGLIMGVWNSHTSVGNILGSLIAGCFVSSNWGMSFIVPGIIIVVMGIVCFLFLIEHPNDLKGISTHTSAQNNTKLQKSWNGRNGQYKPGKTQSWDTELLLPSSGDGGDRSVCVPVQQLVVVKSDTEPSAISFMGALRIPGVVEFSLCLLFAKLVSYTFLFWLPMYITKAAHLDAKRAGDLSTLFDVGGIVGGILAGVVSDKMGKRATTCAVMLLLAAPTLYVFSMISELGLGPTIVMLLVCGGLVNGPYALITTAVSADLGTHKSLKGNARALSTVTAIIDGTGSVGAAVGPLLAGLLSARGWQHVFYMLMTADFLALLLLLRLVMKELRSRKNRSPSVTVELKEH